MATLADYYKSKGQSLPSVSQRKELASQAGISGYTGSAQQNTQLLGYLQKNKTSTQPQSNNFNTSPIAPISPNTTNITPSISAGTIGNVQPITFAQPQPQPQPTEQINYAESLLTAPKQTDNQKFQESTIYDILKGTQDLGGESAMLQQQQEQAGVFAKEAEYRKISDQIRTRQAQTAQERAQINKTPMSFAARSGYEAAVQAANDAEIGALNAQAQAVAGEYEMAINTAQRAVDAKYKPIKEELAIRKAQLEAIAPLLTADEKRQADARDRAIKLEERQYTEAKDLRNKAIDSIVTMIKEGKVTQAVGNQALSDVLAGKKSLSDVFKMVGITNSTNPGVVGGYDISKYATDPEHEIKVASIYKSLPELTDATTADSAVKSLYPSSPITGTMIMNAANQFNVDPKMIFAIMAQDSSMGTAGIGARNFNPGNIGQFDSLGTTPTSGYKSWQEGVNAVAKWLSKNKATGIYNGEFAATLENAVSGESATMKADALKKMQNYVASGDYKSAFTAIGNSVSKALTGKNKETFDAARIEVKVLTNLQKTLQQYESIPGADMNFLKGSVEKIQRKFGELKKDPKFASLAVQMEREFQAYRNQMTGAAFSPGESREYEAVVPSTKKNFDLNYAVITGAVNQLNNRIVSSLPDASSTIYEFSKYQGLKPDDIVLKLGQDKPEFYGTIDQMIKQGIQSDVILEVLGYAPLLK